MSADRNRPSGGSDAPADDLGPSRAVNVAGALPAGFDASFERCGQIARFLDGEDAARLEHSEIESWLEIEGRDLLRAFLQDHLALRACREQRADMVLDDGGVAHRAVERGHERGLQSVFGEVTVSRLAYRARGEENLHLADAALNLPEERASHGVRRLTASECSRGSFDDALQSVRERTGVSLGKQQLLALAARAAVDFDAFYASRSHLSSDAQDERDSDATAVGVGEEKQPEVLVLSADGKGIVMRAEALRAQTAKAAARASPKLRTRLSRGELCCAQHSSPYVAVQTMLRCGRGTGRWRRSLERERNIFSAARGSRETRAGDRGACSGRAWRPAVWCDRVRVA